MMVIKHSEIMLALTIICFTFCLNAIAQDISSTSVPINAGKSNQTLYLRSLPLTFTTTAYHDEVLNLMLLEANKVANELALNEQIPITLSNLVSEHITPPRMAKIGIGSITTSNYVYYFSVGNKFSSVARRDSNQDKNEIKAKYLWPIDHIDTNAAYQMATQWLDAASIDVKALNRDCMTIVRPWTPEGVNGRRFVPLYRVYWITKGTKNSGSVAGVELLFPTKSLQQLYVKKSQYILRNPLQVTNLFSLLKTNDIIK